MGSRKASVDAALAAGAVEVQSASRRPDAAVLLRTITVGAPWYGPLADSR